MNCPFCNKEMPKGIISADGRSTIRWKEGDKKMDVFERIGGIGIVTAAKQKHPWSAITIEAYFCRECKKMIFDTDVTK